MYVTFTKHSQKQFIPENLWCDEAPLGFADGPNKYQYAGNDPVNFRDPSGLSQAGNPLNNLAGGFGGNFVSTVSNAFTNPGQIFNNIGNALGTTSNSLGGALNSGVASFTASLGTSTLGSGTTISPVNNSNNLLTQSIFPNRQPSSPGSTVTVPNFITGNSNANSTPLLSPQAQKIADIDAKLLQQRRERVLQETIEIQNFVASPAVRFDGTPVPRLEASTFDEANRSRLRYLQSKTILPLAEIQEMKELQVLTSSRSDRFNIVVNALSGFAGGFVPPGGTLNVKGPKFDRPIAGGGARLSNLPTETQAAIQSFASRRNAPVAVVGSRASGKTRPNSDFDFVIGANAKVRARAFNELPRGQAGGQIGSRGRESGIDIFNANKKPLDTSEPFIFFFPNPSP